MEKILLDSWAWMEFFENGPASVKILEAVKKAARVFTTTINVHECEFRIMQKEKNAGAVKEGVSFMREKAKIVDIDLKTALLAVELREKHKLHEADSLCYAAALLNDALFVTGDSDFKGLPNVIFVR